MAFERVWHQFYPQKVPAEIDFERITLPEVLTRTAKRFPDNDALVFLGKRISYQDLEGLVNRFARALMDLGVERDDKVAMLLPNIPQLVIADYATFRIGAVTAMNNPLYTERELEHQLNDADAKILITLDLLHPLSLKLKRKTKIKTIITCHINDYLPFPLKQIFPFAKKEMYRRVEPHPDVHEFMDLIKKYPADPLANQARWDEVGALLYTGGTTGVSKGAMLTHANLSSNVQQTRAAIPDFKDGGERELAVFPFFHSAGYTGVQNICIWSGWANILVPRPEPDTIIKIMKKYKPTLVPGVPTIYVGLLNHPEFRKIDLSSIKGFMAGAAPLPLDVIRELKELTGADIMNVYGLTEISPMGTGSPWGRGKAGTVGVPLPSTDLKIVDIETGTQEMPAGETGEVIFKGPQVMKGYYKKPAETAATIRDGWLYTGDIGFLDEEGYLTIVDRKKDMIVASGFNIYPKEVDEILFEHPKVLEACTVGVPDAYRGETVKAFVVVKPGEKLDEKELIAYCRSKLSPYKVPRQVEFISELPKSAVGKILRRKLRDIEVDRQRKVS